MLYLMVELPAIWFLELEKVSTVQDSFNKSVILGDLYKVRAVTLTSHANS